MTGSGLLSVVALDLPADIGVALDGVEVPGGEPMVVKQAHGLSELEDLLSSAEEVDAVIALADPPELGAAVAQAAHRFHRDAAVVLLAEPSRTADVRAALRFAPGVGLGIDVLALDEGTVLLDRLRATLGAASSRRRHRRAVRASSSRLAGTGDRSPRTVPQLGALLQHLPAGVIVLDPAGRVLDHNERAAELLGPTTLGLHVGGLLRDVLAAPEAVDRLVAHCLDADLAESDLATVEVPLVTGNGVIELAAAPTRTSGGEDAVLLIVHDVTSRLAAQAERDAVTERLVFLTDTMSALDPAEGDVRVVEVFAAQLVPFIADRCVVALVDDDRAWVVAAHDVDPIVEGVLRQETGWQVPDELLRCLQTGRETVRRTDDGACAVLPLLSSSVVMGAALLLSRDTSRRYDADDLPYLRDVVRRAAVAVDRARLIAELSHAAHTLQRALLPPEPEHLPGLELAARYLPGAEGTEVGGDWYDVIPLADGRVILVVGDVMGRGVRAAATMGQVRSAMRAYAVDGRSPADLLAALDRLFATLVGGELEAPLVTCVCAMYDPAAGTLTAASAGHPPPLMVDGDGARLLDLTPGLPLGLGGVFTETTTAARPDTVVALYTDGLVETRDDRLDARLELLRLAGESAPADPDAVCEHLLERMGRSTGTDDVALLVMRVPLRTSRPLTGDLRPDASLFLQSAGSAPAEARSWLAAELGEWQHREIVDDGQLLVSELVTNAVRHARTGVELRARDTGSHLRVEVSDSSPREPRPRAAAEDEEGGRGLLLVEMIAERWGVDPLPSGKRVWFELPWP